MNCTVSWCLANHYTLSPDTYPPFLETTSGIAGCLCNEALQGDPDIAGVGVISAFVASTFVSLISAALCLVLGPSDDGNGTFNIIDKWFQRVFCRPARVLASMMGADPGCLSDAFYDVVVSLADQQIVTGIAILSSAAIRTYDRTASNPLSVHHLGIVADLAWFSSNSHLIALVVIRSHRDSAKPWSEERNDDSKGRMSSKLARFLRATLMLVMASLLLWAAWLAGDAGFYDELQCPAACLVNSRNGKGRTQGQWMIFNYFYVLYEYPLAMFALSRSLREWWMDNISLRIHRQDKVTPTDRPYLDALLQRIKRTGGPFSVIKYAFCALWLKEGSVAMSFIEILIYFGLGIMWVLQDRQSGHAEMGDGGKAEGIWGFGQLVPMFLIFIPFIQFWQSYADALAEKRKWIRHAMAPTTAGTDNFGPGGRH